MNNNELCLLINKCVLIIGEYMMYLDDTVYTLYSFYFNVFLQKKNIYINYFFPISRLHPLNLKCFQTSARLYSHTVPSLPIGWVLFYPLVSFSSKQHFAVSSII